MNFMVRKPQQLPGTDASNAKRQARFRERHAVIIQQLGELKHELSSACERGRSAGVTNHLPDPPLEWVPQLVERLRKINLVSYGRYAQRRPRPKQRDALVRMRRLAPGSRDRLVVLYDTHHAENTVEAGKARWAVQCQAHQTTSGYSTLAAARQAVRKPTFCAGCKRELKRGGLET